MKTHYNNLLRYLTLFLYIGLSTLFAAVPVVLSTPVTTVDEDSLYNYELHGSDADGDTLTWSVTNGTTLPSWLDLNGTVSDWSRVGNAGFSAGTAYYTSIAIDSNNTPYIVYKDAENSNKATVKKFDGSSWISVGSVGFSEGTASYTSIAIDSNNTSYVAYQDAGNSAKAVVKKFDGSSWVDVGSAGFSADIVYYTSIAIDSNDTPYVVYKDRGNSSKATVKKFDGSSWVDVGNAGFSAGIADYTSIAIDDNDTLYVAYKDLENNYKATVMKFDGSIWVTVGSAGFSASSVDYTSIAIDSNNTPYVVYKDSGNSHKATVMKFDGSSWITVGNAGFSAGSASYTSIAIDSNNTPYVTYSDGEHGDKATLMKFDGSSWITVGSADFSAGSAHYTFLALDSNDTPYVVYKDGGNSNKATVKKFTTAILTGIPTNDDVGVHDINLTLTDGSSDIYHNFTITVNNVNDAPTDINISNNSIVEENVIGDTIGTLSTTDVDIGDSFTYTFCGGIDDANFSIDGATLKANSVFDYDGKHSYSICVQTSDSAAATFNKSFTININSIPTVTSTALTTVDEDSLYSYELYANDADGDTLTWSLTSGSTLPSWLDLTRWNNVGNAGFSADSVDYTVIAIDSNDTPYVVYQDGENSNKATVKKFDGSSWITVGSAGFSAGEASYTSIAIDSNNIPYVAYQDAGNSSKATVKKFDGSSWVTVGSAGFSAGSIDYTSIAIDSNDTPYLVYKDRGNSSKATVKKFDGSSWVTVGNAGFSAGIADYTSIVIDDNDTPYVVYKDRGNSFKATVMKFDGSSWVTVGNAGFSVDIADYTSIALDSNNIPYVVYMDIGNSAKATVMKFDGSSWITVGNAGFSVGTAHYTSIAIDSNNTPYVTYSDGEHDDKATLMKFDGSSWITVGSAGFSAGSAHYTFVAIDSNDTPYVVYKDRGNNYKATVKKSTTVTLTGTPTNDDVGVYDINLTLTDGSSDVAHNFTITVNNVNDAPTDINISSNFIVEENVIGDTIGTVLTTDVDVGDIFTYTFCGGIDDANFSIDGDTLRANSVFDYDGKHSYSICVQTSDSAAATFNKSFTININSIPTVTSTALTTVDEDSLYSYELHANNADGDALTWSVTSGSSLPSWLDLNVVYSAWSIVDTAGFSAGSADYTSIAIDSNNTPYVVYQDGGNSHKATVQKFDGNSWTTVGTTGFSVATASYTSIAIDNNNTPYVAYSDGGNSYKATVMKFDGSSWVNVGIVGFSAGSVMYSSIAIDSNNTPYVAYRDGGNSGKATVMKFNDSSWVDVGSSGFSADTAYYTSVALDSDDTPYVAYEDWGNGGKATIKKFDGSSWVTVGSAGFSAGTAYYTSIALDSNDTPYVVYRDGGNSSKATVKKFDGSSWVTVGNAGFGAGQTDYTSIAIDSNDIPYVTYKAGGYGNKAFLMKFDGSSWVTIGSSGISASQVAYTSIALDSNDTPYVVYQDVGNSGKATVQKHSPTVTTLTGTPTNADVGVHNINLTLTDGSSNVTHNFTLTVNNVNDAPILSTIANQSKLEDFGNYTIQLSATDIDSNTLTYSASSSNPNIVTVHVNGTSLTLTSLANANGVVSVNYSVNDGYLSDTKSFTLTVNAVDDAPTLDALANLSTLEDAAQSNITLSAYDAENNLITFSVSSSNPSIVKVDIVNGHLIVTQLPDASGVVNIEVNATANGKIATRDFDVEVKAVNDAPSIVIQLLDKTILEDAPSFSVDMNVSDVDGNTLTMSIVSDNNALVTLTPNWTNPLNQAAYSQTLDFTIAVVPNVNGSANITLVVDDGTTSRSQTFILNVTAVNDAPILEPLADRIYYNNFTDKQITLDASDNDDINLTYSASIGTSDIIDSATLNANILTLKSLSGAYGDTNITVSVRDEHGKNSLMSSQKFHLRVLSIESGEAQEEVIYTDINETNRSTTYSNIIKTKDFKIVVKRIENKDGTVAQEIVLGDKVVKATSDLNGSKVAMTPEGVHTLYDDATLRAEVTATLTGQTTQKLTVNGKTTEATSEVIGATTQMSKDAKGNIEIITTLKNSDSTISVITKADGTTEYEVHHGLKTTRVVSSIPGAKTVIKAGYIETIVDIEPVNGVFFRAIVKTKTDGTTVSSFEKINSDGTVIETFDAFVPTTPYAAGNQITIQTIGSKTYIVATTPLSANRLRVK